MLLEGDAVSFGVDIPYSLLLGSAVGRLPEYALSPDLCQEIGFVSVCSSRISPNKRNSHADEPKNPPSYDPEQFLHAGGMTNGLELRLQGRLPNPLPPCR